MMTLRTAPDGQRVLLLRERTKATVLSHGGHFVTVRLDNGRITNRSHQTGVKQIVRVT